MQCWICRDEGTTGEHLTKLSDLKSHFGHVSQNSPLYFHTDNIRNSKLKSIKKDPRLKSSALICAPCNNAKTSKYDKSWERLSNYLRHKTPPIKKGDIIKLEKVFPGAVKQSMLRVHLFFVKLFGCAIVAHNVPINIEPLRNGLLQEKPVNNVYLAFWSSSGMGDGYSEMEYDTIGDKCTFATWFYTIGAVSVNVMYALPNENRLGLLGSWHPSNITKRVKIAGM